MCHRPIFALQRIQNSKIPKTFDLMITEDFKSRQYILCKSYTYILVPSQTTTSGGKSQVSQSLSSNLHCHGHPNAILQVVQDVMSYASSTSCGR